MQNMFVVNTESRLSKIPTLYIGDQIPLINPMIYTSVRTKILINHPTKIENLFKRVEAMAVWFLKPSRKFLGLAYHGTLKRTTEPPRKTSFNS